MRVIAIIQARMGSKRLPGKSMLHLAGKPLVYRLLERVKRCMLIDEVVLAIPNTTENDCLAEIASTLEVSLFRGSELDLVDRYWQAAKMFDAELVVRIPADNPVPEPREVDKIIQHHVNLGQPAFSTNLANVMNSGYPDGIGAEVFDFSLLDYVQKHETSPMKREHVHLNFFDYSTQISTNSSWCQVTTISCPEEYARPDIVLDVNTKSQYIMMAKLYEDLFYRDASFGIKDIIPWYDKMFSGKGEAI